MVHDVLVVGAGPAGISAAIAAAEQGASVLFLERMQAPALKFLVSGSGQCNLSHAGPIAEFMEHFGGGVKKGDSGRFLRPALFGYSNTDLVAFCADRGLDLEESANGKLFPVTRRSRDVVDLFLAEAIRLGVEIQTSVRILSARKSATGFELGAERGADPTQESRRESDPTFQGRCLILATGGKSYLLTGSDGDGYALALSLGHTLVEPGPALTPVLGSMSGAGSYAPFVDCSGVSIPGTPISVFRRGRKTAEGRGDVLFTHRGLSGPGILDLSRNIRPGDEVRVSLAPGNGGSEACAKKLLAAIEAQGKRSVLRLLSGFGLPDSLARATLVSLGIESQAKAAELTRAARSALAASLAEGGDGGHAFYVANLGSWSEAMVTRGGVPLAEVNPKTMESRLVPGLFFAGELLDYDGDTGGYNIQAALSTGRLAGLQAGSQAGKPVAANPTSSDENSRS